MRSARIISAFFILASLTAAVHADSPRAIFGVQTIPAPSLTVSNSWSPGEHVEFVQLLAPMFGRGYTLAEAWNIVRGKLRIENYEAVHLNIRRQEPRFLKPPQDRRLIRLMHIVEGYYMRQGNEAALDLLRSTRFFFVDKEKPWKDVNNWHRLIFTWKGETHFLGGYAQGQTAYLPYALVQRLLDIHQDATRIQFKRVKGLSLEILSELLHHEAEHLVHGPWWEDPVTVRRLVKKLDRLFEALDKRNPEPYITVISLWDRFLEWIHWYDRPPEDVFQQSA
jgi:hypothetical protein